MKKYILILIIPFLLNCSTFKKGKNTNNSTSIQQVIPSINDFNKADTNKDNVIDKNESIKFFNKNNSIDYNTPFAVFSMLSTIVMVICFWPIVYSYLTSLIKRFKNRS
jgi:hypothetical protein